MFQRFSSGSQGISDAFPGLSRGLRGLQKAFQKVSDDLKGLMGFPGVFQGCFRGFRWRLVRLQGFSGSLEEAF